MCIFLVAVVRESIENTKLMNERGRYLDMNICLSFKLNIWLKMVHLWVGKSKIISMKMLGNGKLFDNQHYSMHVDDEHKIISSLSKAAKKDLSCQQLSNLLKLNLIRISCHLNSSYLKLVKIRSVNIAWIWAAWMHRIVFNLVKVECFSLLFSVNLAAYFWLSYAIEYGIYQIVCLRARVCVYICCCLCFVLTI